MKRDFFRDALENSRSVWYNTTVGGMCPAPIEGELEICVTRKEEPLCTELELISAEPILP